MSTRTNGHEERINVALATAYQAAGKPDDAIAPLAAPEPDALCARVAKICCDGAMTATAERLLWPPPGACARAEGCASDACADGAA